MLNYLNELRKLSEGSGSRSAAYVLVLALLASSMGFGLPWPSSAELETFGTAAIGLWAVLMILHLRKEANQAVQVN